MSKTFHHKLKNKIYIIIALIVLIILLLVGVSVYYSNKFYPHTTINQVDVSGLTLAQAQDKIEDYMKDYTMEISGRNDGTLSLRGSDIDLVAQYQDQLQSAFDKAHQGLSFYHVFTNNQLEESFSVSYNEESLKSVLDDSLFVEGNDSYSIQSPISAHVEYDETSQAGKIVAEVQGNEVDKDKFYEYIETNIQQLNQTVNLEDGDVYKKPTYTSQQDVIQDQLKTYNSYLYKWITWDMGENKTETITPTDIKDWLKINDDATVDIDKDKLSEWIEDFCLKYKTVGKKRNFKTHSGKVIQIGGGDYGWRINYDKTVDQAYDAIKSEVNYSDVENYINNPSDSLKKKLTIEKDVIYSQEGYKKDYTNFQDDWDTQNYSEIDLTAQKVYVYKNGSLVLEAKIVSGLASDPTRATRTGVWYIKDKKETYTLTGEDYKTPTKYWVRITWTGTGYHYMNRSDWSKWTPDLYKTKGSHGCLNMQLNDVKALYSYVKIGDPVFIHH